MTAMNFRFKWRHQDGSTVEFSASGWASDDPLKLDLLSKMNGLCPSGLPIAPAVRSWLLDECKLIEFSGPELDRTLGMAAHSKVQHNGSLLFPGRGAA
jgi:hypothetical protein